MGRLRTNSDDCRGVVGDVFIVEGEADGTYKCGVAMFCFVLVSFRDDSRERMDAFQLIIRNEEEYTLGWQAGRHRLVSLQEGERCHIFL